MERLAIGLAGGADATKVEALRSAMEATLGREVEVFVADSYARLAEALGAGRVSLAWLPPVPAIGLGDRVELLALPVRDGAVTFRAALFVTIGGPRTLEALAGLRAAWVDPESAAGHVIPRAMLAAAGHDPATFFRSEVFLRSHDRVVEAVLADLADVGATYCRTDDAGKIVWAGWAEHDGLYPRRVDVVALSEPIPNDGFCAGRTLSGALRDAFVHALTDGPVCVAAKSLLRAERFVPAEPAHHAQLRALLGR